MKRAFMFLLLGPASIVTTWLIYVTAKQGPWGIAAPVATILFIFVFFVAAIAALFDQFLARALPAFVRASLTAIVGAAIPVSVILAVSGCMLPEPLVMPFAIGGALCTGVCSLLSNDCGHRHRLALPTAAEQ